RRSWRTGGSSRSSRWRSGASSRCAWWHRSRAMTEFVVTAVLLLANAFFVGAEFSLIASRRTVVEPLAATSRRARAALTAMGQIPLMIAGAQLGITVCSLGLGAITEPTLAHLIERPFAAMGLPPTAVHPVAFVLALGVVVFLHTVVGEMVPKNL